MAELRIVGVDDLLKQLDKMERVVAKKLIAQALREAGKMVQKKASELAPVGEGPTHLADNIIVQVKEQTATGAVALIGPSKEVFYGSFQEFGTAHHMPQPFLEPAYEQQADDIVDLVGDVLGKGIERELGI